MLFPKSIIAVILCAVLMMPSVFAQNTSTEYDNKISDYECTNAGGWETEINKSIDNSVYHSGNSSLKVSASGSRQLNQFSKLFQSNFYNSFPLENGQSYYYSFWIKTTNPALKSYGLYTPYYYKKMGQNEASFASPHYHTKSLNGTTDWQYISGSFEANLSDFANNAGATPIELYFTIVAWDTSGSNLSNIDVWIDQVSLRKIPAESDSTSLVSVYPSLGEKNVGVNTSIEFGFDHDVNFDCITADNIYINNAVQTGKVSISKIYDSASGQYKLVITPLQTLTNSVEYSVAVSGLYDAWGRLISGEPVTHFTVIDSLTIDKAFYNGNNELVTTICGGDIRAQYKITNNTDQNKPAIIIMALCNDQYIEKVAVSEAKTIGSLASSDFSALLPGVPEGDGYYIRIILWDGLSTHRAIADIFDLN